MIDTALGGGRSVYVNGVVQVTSGSFVVAGYLRDAAGLNEPFIVRYLPDGRRDPAFGANGVVFPPAQFMQPVALPDGRVVGQTIIPATPKSPPIQAIGFVNPDGSMSTTPIKNIAVRQLVGRPDGSIVVVGYRYQPPLNNFVASLLLPNGSVDSSYLGDVTAALPSGASLATDVLGATLLTDGRLVVSFGYMVDGKRPLWHRGLGPVRRCRPDLRQQRSRVARFGLLG